jgi:hypothetical protein
MIAVKGLYNGKRIEFLEPLPKKQAQKKNFSGYNVSGGKEDIPRNQACRRENNE